MKRKTFLCSYLTSKDGIAEVDEELAVQNALTEVAAQAPCFSYGVSGEQSF